MSSHNQHGRWCRPLPPAPYLLQKAQVESVATTAEADVLGALDSIHFDEVRAEPPCALRARKQSVGDASGTM